jgi:hypothetical protein
VRVGPSSAALILLVACACTRDDTNDADEALGSGRVAVVNERPVPESVLRIYALATERRNLDDLGAEDRERL